MLSQVCDRVLDSPVVKWALRIVQMLACMLLVQTIAMLWIAASLAKQLPLR